MENRNVLLVTDTYWPIQGGVEEAVRTIAAALPMPFIPTILIHEGPRPHGRTLFSTAAPAPFGEYRDPAGRRVVPLLPRAAGRVLLHALKMWDLPGIRGKNASRFYDSLYWFYRNAYRTALKQHIGGSSLVHCFSTGYLSRCTAEVCGSLKVPLIQNPFIHFGKWGDSPMQIADYAAADAIICPTHHFRRRLHDRIGAAHREIEVIPPVIAEPDGIPVPPASGTIATPFILFLGRREGHKGMDMLLETLSRAGMPPVRLVAAGPANGQSLRQKNVIDLGLVPEPVKQWLLSQCTFLCVPSVDESFGMVYVEAMRSGKPVVALDIPAMHEIVEQGVSGVLVPPGDTDALAGAITRILTDADMQKRMGMAARKRFEERFSGKASMERIVALYGRLMKMKYGDL